MINAPMPQNDTLPYRRVSVEVVVPVHNEQHASPRASPPFATTSKLLAEERGYRISEVPVDWIEDLDSRVEVASTAAKDVRGLLRVRAQRLRRWLSGWRSRDELGTARGDRPGAGHAFLAGASEAWHGPLAVDGSSEKGRLRV